MDPLAEIRDQVNAFVSNPWLQDFHDFVNNENVKSFKKKYCLYVTNNNGMTLPFFTLTADDSNEYVNYCGVMVSNFVLSGVDLSISF